MHTRWFLGALTGALVLAMAMWFADRREPERPHEPPPPPPPPSAIYTEPPPPPAPPEPETKPSYVANTNRHKFHRMSCRYANCPNCTVYFKTRDEALAAGFRPGGCCDP